MGEYILGQGELTQCRDSAYARFDRGVDRLGVSTNNAAANAFSS